MVYESDLQNLLSYHGIYVKKVLLDESDDAPTNEKAEEITAKVIDIFEDDIDYDTAIDLGLDANAENFIADKDE